MAIGWCQAVFWRHVHTCADPCGRLFATLQGPFSVGRAPYVRGRVPACLFKLWVPQNPPTG